METITRHVKDMGSADRQALERLTGRSLTDDHRLIIHVLNVDEPHRPAAQSAEVPGALPPWCNVYEGLTDEAISAVEATILTRANVTRAAE
jgi:hypothetical protein